MTTATTADPSMDDVIEVTNRSTRTVGQLLKVIAFGESKPKDAVDERKLAIKVCNVIHQMIFWGVIGMAGFTALIVLEWIATIWAIDILVWLGFFVIV